MTYVNINLTAFGRFFVEGNMEEFRTIYRILKELRTAMDQEEIDPECISAESIGLSYPKWSRLMVMLVEEGYIKGIAVIYSMSSSIPRIKMTRPEITLKGLEYLEENSLMKKAERLAKGIKDSIPGL